MRKVLLNDCNPEISQKLIDVLSDDISVTDEPFTDNQIVTEYNLIILFSKENDKHVFEKIKTLRFLTKFRNIPIILLKEESDFDSDQPYFLFGASDVLSIASPKSAFKQILQSYLSPSRQPLDREMIYLQPFIESTIDVFKTIASLKINFKKVYFLNDLRIMGDVSGVIGLSGKAEGTIIITFLWDLAKKVICESMGVQQHEINAELIHDGVGEIINMISGLAKKSLSDTEYYFQLSLPTVVVGCGHEIGHPENASIAVLLFEVEDQAFAVHVSLISKIKKTSK